MIFRLPSISRILAVLILLAAVVSAQEEGPGAGLSPEQIKAMRNARTQKGEPHDGDKVGEGDEKWSQMTPEQRLEASMRRGSKAYCRFDATCRPPQLLPGQSGTMMITAILQGQAVLPAPLQMTMTPRVAPGAVSVGGLTAHPALPGTIAKAYLGRPVYENTAVFEVPVVMGAEAKLGEKQTIAVDLQFDIFDGVSGQTVGRFIERVSAEVEVAAHVDPKVAGRSRKPDVDPGSAAAAVGEVVKPASQPVNVPDDNAMSGSAVEIPVPTEPDPAAEPEATGAATLPPTGAEEDGARLMLMVGGAVFLLVIVLLLMRKK